MAPRDELRRWVAPFAFLLAVTIAVVLVHRALSNDDNAPPAQTTISVARTPAPARKPPRRQPATTNGAEYYVVQSGDTFGSIATRYGITITQVESLNPGISSNALVVGQRIRVK